MVICITTARKTYHVTLSNVSYDITDHDTEQLTIVMRYGPVINCLVSEARDYLRARQKQHDWTLCSVTRAEEEEF